MTTMNTGFSTTHPDGVCLLFNRYWDCFSFYSATVHFARGRFYFQHVQASRRNVRSTARGPKSCGRFFYVVQRSKGM